MKIFGIGLSKTGTTSLNQALTLLGYKSKHFPFEMLEYDNCELTFDIDYVNRYDALVDLPVALLFQMFDKLYPNSKFIYTTRNIGSWVKSAERSFSKTRSAFTGLLCGLEFVFCLECLYGSKTFEFQSYVDGFKRHEEKVRNYFLSREEDLLVLDICSGEGWEELCSFLDKSIPNIPFPYKNKKSSIRNIVPFDILGGSAYYWTKKLRRGKKGNFRGRD